MLLTQGKRGLSIKALSQKIARLIELVQLRNGKIATILEKSNYDEVVDKALDVMDRLVINRDGIVMISNDNAYLELAMYRNQLLHHFAPESLVSIAIIHLMNRGLDYWVDCEGAPLENEQLPQESVRKGDVMTETQFLSHLLRHEFVYKPARNFDVNFDETLDFMIHTEHILRDEWHDSSHNVLSINEGSSETVWFLAMLVWPFVDIYWIIANSLKELLPDKILSTKEFAQKISSNAAAKYYEGEIDFFECVGFHSITNALRWFQTKGILTSQSVQIRKSTFLTQNRGTTVSVFQLSKGYRTEEAIQEWIHHIEQYRKPMIGRPRRRDKQSQKSRSFGSPAVSQSKL